MAVAIAVVSCAVALVVACFTVWVTAPLRRLEFDQLARQLGDASGKLDECERDRRLLRGRLEVLQQALLGLLPPEHRDALLEQLDAVTPPYGLPEAA